jgi:hypothetical protein
MSTPGEQAQQIVRWAWDDPAGRAADALSSVGELARTSPHDNEVTDAAVMLSRLVSSLEVTGDDGTAGR